MLYDSRGGNCLLRTKPDCWTREISYGRFIAWLHSPLPVALVLPLRTPSYLKQKSKVFKYAKWPLKWLANESLVSDLMK